jgi:hypothetical protein
VRKKYFEELEQGSEANKTKNQSQEELVQG